MEAKALHGNRPRSKGNQEPGQELTPRPSQTEQVHLRLSKSDAAFLRRLAEERDQSLSGAVRYLLKSVRKLRGT